MTDGREKNGGARAGSGRKTRREEDDLQKLLKKCVPKERREAILKKLAEDAESTSFKTRNESRKLLLAYLWGKPIARQEITGEGGKDLFPTLNITIEPPAPSQAGPGAAEPGD